MTLAAIWTALLSHLWQSSLVLLVFLGVARLLRGAPARYEHALWTLGLLKLLVPLAAGGALVRTVLPGPGPSRAGFGLDPVWTDPGAGLAPVLQAGAGERIVLLATLMWIAGSGFLLFRLAREQLRAARLRGTARAPRGPEIAALALARRGTAVPAGALRVTDVPVGPAVVGLVRPVILLGTAVLRMPAPELRAILEHEEAHRARRDPARTFARRLVAALLFFYPPVVPLLRRLHETAEYAADEHALRSSGPDLLARALARVVGLGLAPAPDPAASGNALLSRRFARLAHSGRKAMPVHRLALAAAVSLALVASFLPVSSAESPAEEPAFDTPPSVTHRVAPVYPKESRDVAGRVLVEITVTPEGDATDLEVIEAIDGHPEFSDAATDALAQWRFSPALRDGKAVAARIAVPFKFELRDRQKREAEAPDR